METNQQRTAVNFNAKKVELSVWSNVDAHGSGVFLVSDRFGRFRMSSGLIEMLKCDDTAYKAYLAYDAANKRVALGPVGVVQPTDARPITFDAKRHYTTARGFFAKHALQLDKIRYVYDGAWNCWHMFRMETHKAGDGRGTE